MPLAADSIQCTAFIVIGLAGSGKTTFCQRLYSWLNSETLHKDGSVVLKNGLNSSIASINLDPAVKNPKMPLTVDIRDTIDYKETMERYNLGPNGCINTCLNLFLINFIPPEARYTIVDTPGQIEAFTWSSPGEVAMKLFKNAIILYIADLELCSNKGVFVNNMLFAGALKSRFNRPVLVLFNKSDLGDQTEVSKWIKDSISFREAVGEADAEAGRLALYFDEFYNNLDFVFVSSLTGQGKLEFYDAVARVARSTGEEAE